MRPSCLAQFSLNRQSANCAGCSSDSGTSRPFSLLKSTNIDWYSPLCRHKLWQHRASRSLKCLRITHAVTSDFTTSRACWPWRWHFLFSISDYYPPFQYTISTSSFFTVMWSKHCVGNVPQPVPEWEIRFIQLHCKSRLGWLPSIGPKISRWLAQFLLIAIALRTPCRRVITSDLSSVYSDMNYSKFLVHGFRPLRTCNVYLRLWDMSASSLWCL